MNRTLLIFAVFFVCCIASCTKSTIFGEAQYKAQAKIDDSIVSKYIASQGLRGKFKHVQNNDTIGVYYMILDTGATNTLFTTSTQVTVGDTGKLLSNGNVFYETNDFHPSYSLGSVIRGWQLGIPEGSTGGEIRLLIPSRYAYGHYPPSQIGIPPDAVLDFSIRLYNVIN